MIRVLVVDDHELIRESISSALDAAGGIDVVGSCVDGQDAVGFAASSRPDVVLMDLSMPRLNGVDATRQILANDPSVRVVIFTSAVNGRQVKEAIDIGAVSCVFKGADTTDLIRAVRAAVLPV
jgi:DNA-binding NarL/FixJ family response regulator